MVLSHDGFCFRQCGEPPLNLKMFVSGNAFDNSTFFYEQLKFTWLGRVVILYRFWSRNRCGQLGPNPALR